MSTFKPYTPGQSATKQAALITYPLTLHRPPQFSGDEWTEEVYNTPAELLAMLAQMERDFLAEMP